MVNYQDELARLRQSTVHQRVCWTSKDSVNEQTRAAEQHHHHQQQQQQLRELYDAEARLRQKFTARLDTATQLANKSPTLYVHL